MSENTRDHVVSRIRVPRSVLSNIDEARQTVQNNPELTKRERQFLKAALELAVEYHKQGEDPSFDYRTFNARLMRHGMPLRENSIRNRLSQLTHKGFFQNLELPIASHIPSRRPREFYLQNIHASDFESTNEAELNKKLAGRVSERSSNPREILAHLRESDAQLAAFDENTKRRTDNIWTGLADRVMRFSRRETPQDNRIETEIRMFDTPLFLQMTTQTGLSSELATLQDQRVIRAIVSQVAHLIETKKEQWWRERAAQFVASAPIDELGNELTPQLGEKELADLETYIENSFYIDVTDIARMLGYKNPGTGSSRRHINMSIRRLYESNFRLVIQSDDPQRIRRIMDAYDLDDIAADFRFIADLKSQYNTEFYRDKGRAKGQQVSTQTAEQVLDPYQGDEFERVRVWQISIDRHLYRKLIRDTRSALFTAHEEILKESSGLAQSLYNWVSHIIGRTDQKITGNKERVCNQSLEVIQKILWPWRKYTRFEESIVQIIRQHSKEGTFDSSLSYNQVRMWGYYWTLYRRGQGKLMLHVERDPKDPITGDESFPNRKLRHHVNRSSGDGWEPGKQSSLPGI